MPEISDSIAVSSTFVKAMPARTSACPFEWFEERPHNLPRHETAPPRRPTLSPPAHFLFLRAGLARR
jgi:hypothetical protein